jgi:hypothetical protein
MSAHMVLTRAKAAVIATPTTLMAPLSTQVMSTFAPMRFIVISAAASD